MAWYTLRALDPNQERGCWRENEIKGSGAMDKDDRPMSLVFSLMRVLHSGGVGAGNDYGQGIYF